MSVDRVCWDLEGRPKAESTSIMPLLYLRFHVGNCLYKLDTIKFQMQKFSHFLLGDASCEIYNNLDQSKNSHSTLIHVSLSSELAGTRQQQLLDNQEFGLSRLLVNICKYTRTGAKCLDNWKFK